MPTIEILTIGSLTLDIFVRPLRHEIVRHYSENTLSEFLSFPFGEKIRVKDVHECFGGGGGNLGVGFARQGIKTSAIGAIGDDEWGKLVIENLKKENIKTDNIQKVNDKTGFSVILNSFEGERTVLAYSGANRAIEKIDEKLIENVDGVHLCHLSGKGAKLFDTLKDYFLRNPQKFLSWNPGKEQFEKGFDYFKNFFPVVDVLVMNKEEAEEFSDIKTNKESVFGENIYDMSLIFQKFYHNGFGGILAITDGRRGSQASDGKKIVYCEIDDNSPRTDTLGAGDAFTSGFSGAIYKKKDLHQAIKYGTLNAANVVALYGAQTGLMNTEELENQINKTKLKNKEIPLFSKIN